MYDPRTDPMGAFHKTCAHCGEDFRTDNERALYCTEACKKAAAYQRWKANNPDSYAAHAERVRENKKK